MGLLDRPGQPQRYGLLDPNVMGLIQSGGPRVAPAPAAPRRERVSGWRVFDRVLGGQTVTEGLDAERARLEAEALRPQARQRMEANRAAAAAMGPAALIAFDANPESFGESLGMQYRPVTTAEGSITSYGPGEGARRVAAPVVERFDDRFGSFDPLNPQAGARYTAARGPTQSELTAEKVAETGRINALNVPVAANTDLVDPTTGRQIYQGFRAPEVNSVPQGGSLAVTDPLTGAVINTVQGNPDPVPGGRNGIGNFDATTRGALQAASSAAALARQRAADANRFITLNRANPTGTGAALLGPAVGLNPAYAEMRAISARLVPGERTPGSGPMSDGDAVLYGRAVLDVDKPGPANQALADVVIASAERDADYASFLDEYANLNGNLVGANEDWQAYVNANPLFSSGANGQTVRRPAREIQPWRDFMGFGERQRGGAQARARGGQPAAAAAPAQGQPVRIYNDDDYARLPSGATFQGPDGVTRRKP
jgi:hypothetical protein